MELTPEVQKIQEIAKKEALKVLGQTGFTKPKVTDTPTDALSMVNRKYVNLNGTTANRPTTSITGQFYFDTTLGKPVWWKGNDWVDATGTHA